MYSNLSIVIPNHKEEKILAVVKWCKALYPNAEVVVGVDTDGRGKGWAIREGLKLATKPIVCFIDGDMDVDPRDILQLLSHDEDVVVAVKSLKGLPWHRKFISICSRLVIKVLFNLPISDTQTGLKVFRKPIPDFETNGWAFDIEILYKLHLRGATFKEVPIIVTSSKSKGLKDICTTLYSILCLKYRLLFQSSETTHF